jgi:hypothetical protein
MAVLRLKQFLLNDHFPVFSLDSTATAAAVNCCFLWLSHFSE